MTFVIDGKPRGSRGKGLRAVTHAAVTLALLEYCQEHSLPHPGFIVLDSPLLAYYKPEGDEDFALQGSDLKERFYTYLVEHHGQNSQVIILENQHPPSVVESRLSMTVFTHNPSKGLACYSGGNRSSEIPPSLATCPRLSRLGLGGGAVEHQPALAGGERRPANMPAIDKSSSRRGQWMPIGMIS